MFGEGSAVGKATGQFLSHTLGRGSLDWKTTAAMGLYRAHGLGSVSVEVEEPRSRFRLKVSDCAECSGARTNRNECSFMRGHLVGLVSTLFGSEFRSEEAKCRLRGDRHCEFFLAETRPGEKAANRR